MNEEIDYIPGLLIGHLITDEEYRRKKYGEKLLIYAIFIGKEVSKIAGCRYIIVDAYTTNEAIQFYLSIEFKFLFRGKGKRIIKKLENGEKPKEKTTKMYFDLRRLTILYSFKHLVKYFDNSLSTFTFLKSSNNALVSSTESIIKSSLILVLI